MRERMVELETQTRFMEARSNEVEGAPLPWEDGYPISLQPLVVEALVNKTLAQVGKGSRLMALDCEEFPCIAIVASPSDGEDGSLMTMESLRDSKSGGQMLSHADMGTFGGRVQYHSVAMVGGEIREDEEKRIRFRDERLLKTVTTDLLNFYETQ